MIAFNQNGDEQPDESRGAGGKEYSQRDQSGLTQIKAGRMLTRAINGGWLARRWDTDLTAKDLEEAQKQRQLTAKEMAMVAVMADMTSKDARPRQIAVKNLLTMEAQNQSDEHEYAGGNKTLIHRHTHEVSTYSDDDLLAIIEGTFEETGGVGNVPAPNGETEPT